MSIEHRLREIRLRIEQAEQAAGRTPGEVRLVAVSKFHPAEAIRDAYAAGQRDFGESYVAELLEKRTALADLPDIRWHFIGHLQSRKAKALALPEVLVHGLASLSALQRLDAHVLERGLEIPVLLQINVGGEATKSGVPPEAARELGAALIAAKGLAWRGLMTIPPPAAHAEDAAANFRRLRQLRDTLSATFSIDLPELSMGMSDDFEPAIAEGATLVRVGTAIFGNRPTE